MRAPFLVAIALIASITGGCYDPNEVAAPDEVLLLTATPETIPANGFATSRIIARISTSANRDLTISFSTSGGTLSSTAARGPDGNGEASVFLTSDSTPKTVSVTAEVKEGATLLVSRSVPVTFELAAPESVLRLTVSSSQLEADGVSSLELRAESNPAGPGRTVSFSTTDGSFVRGATPPALDKNNVATGADGVARAQLFAPIAAGTALVTATANGFSASQTISFVPARPDFITLTAEPLATRASEINSIALVAVLSRPVGAVSRNTRVEFEAVNDDSGQSFGRFQNVTRSNDMERATAQFVPGALAPVGLATITARVADNNAVLASIKVNIIP